MRFTRDRFNHLWQRLGLEPPGHDLFARLRDAYAEPHRAYHTARHIEECLGHLDACGEAAPEIELAIWFHDAVYDPKADDNEARSAAWAAREMSEAEELKKTVERLILATKHDAVPQAEDERLLTDIDLAILGASPDRFEEYERQIRQEYAWVPEDTYERERARVLRSFSDRDSIYSTSFFRERLEAQARRNLTRTAAPRSDRAWPP